jgi:hypothetical protein
MDNLLRIVIPALIGVAGTVLGAVVTYVLSKRRISDKEIFLIWRMAFDRRAFKGPYIWNSDPIPFKQAIDDTILAINTGVIATRKRGIVVERGKGKSYIRNKKWRLKMDEVEKGLINISDMSGNIVNLLEEGESLDDLPSVIDFERNEIIKMLNEIWSTLRIPILPIPTDIHDFESANLPTLDYDLQRKIPSEK